MGNDAIQHCRSYALEAERKMGQMLIAGKVSGEVAKKGRPKNIPTGNIIPASTEDLNLSLKESAAAQLLAELDAEDFEKIKAGKKTRSKATKERKAAKDREQMEAAAKAIAADRGKIPAGSPSGLGRCST